MAGRRVRRLNEQFKREVAEILRRSVQDPRVAGVTVTGAEVTPDLYSARLFVRVAGGDEERDRALEGLDAAAPYIRRQLGAVLRVRRVPELHFQEDRTLEQALRIEEILREVRPDGPNDEEPDDAPAVADPPSEDEPEA